MFHAVMLCSGKRGWRKKGVSGQDVPAGQRQGVSNDDWNANFTGMLIQNASVVSPLLWSRPLNAMCYLCRKDYGILRLGLLRLWLIASTASCISTLTHSLTYLLVMCRWGVRWRWLMNGGQHRCSRHLPTGNSRIRLPHHHHLDQQQQQQLATEFTDYYCGMWQRLTRTCRDIV